MVHVDPAFLRKHPIWAVLFGLVAIVAIGLLLQSGMGEARALLRQKAPSVVSVREATRLQGIRWITLTDGTWHCAEAIRIENHDIGARLLFGSIANTEVPITGDDVADVIVARFDGNFDCSQKPAQLSGVVGSFEIFGSSSTLSRWRAAGRRVTVLDVGSSPSTAFWLAAGVAAILLVAAIFTAYYMRLLLRTWSELKPDESVRLPDRRM